MDGSNKCLKLQNPTYIPCNYCELRNPTTANLAIVIPSFLFLINLPTFLAGGNADP